MSRFCSEHWFWSPYMTKCWKMGKSGSYICSRVQTSILQGFCTLGMGTKSPRFRLLTPTTNIDTRFCVFSAFGHIRTWKPVLGAKPAHFRKNAVISAVFGNFFFGILIKILSRHLKKYSKPFGSRNFFLILLYFRVYQK